MDFSLAQRKAHSEEYADIMIAQIPSFHLLSPETQQSERSKFITDATEAQAGCQVHWKRSVLRIRGTAAHVSKEKRAIFDRLTRTMLDERTTPEEFSRTTDELLAIFPSIKGWINWWLMPIVAAMIFPACQTGDKRAREQVPKTSNPVEAHHSLSHRGIGTKLDAIPGVEGVIRRVQEIESRYHQIKGSSVFELVCCLSTVLITHLFLSAGTFKAPPPRDPRPHRQKKLSVNDGRAPDTAEMLEAVAERESHNAEENNGMSLYLILCT